VVKVQGHSDPILICHTPSCPNTYTKYVGTHVIHLKIKKSSTLDKLTIIWPCGQSSRWL
jgi:hypothetical protein